MTCIRSTRKYTQQIVKPQENVEKTMIQILYEIMLEEF
jgi:hypothetical protein